MPSVFEVFLNFLLNSRKVKRQNKKYAGNFGTKIIFQENIIVQRIIAQHAVVLLGKIACGQQPEWFRSSKTRQFWARNFFISGKCAGERIKVFERGEIALGGV